MTEWLTDLGGARQPPDRGLGGGQLARPRPASTTESTVLRVDVAAALTCERALSACARPASTAASTVLRTEVNAPLTCERAILTWSVTGSKAVSTRATRSSWRSSATRSAPAAALASKLASKEARRSSTSLEARSRSSVSCASTLARRSSMVDWASEGSVLTRSGAVSRSSLALAGASSRSCSSLSPRDLTLVTASSARAVRAYAASRTMSCGSRLGRGCGAADCQTTGR